MSVPTAVEQRMAEVIRCPWPRCEGQVSYQDKYLNKYFACPADGCHRRLAPVRCPVCGRLRSLRVVSKVGLMLETCTCGEVLAFARCSVKGCNQVFPYPPSAWPGPSACPSCRAAGDLASRAEVIHGRFPLLEPLGRGAFNDVHRSFHPELRLPVAVKLPRTAIDPESEEWRRFTRDAQIIAGLPPTGIVRIYDLGIEGGRPYIVSELLDGRSLEEEMLQARMNKEPLEGRRAAEIIGQVAEALGLAHRKGIVHRDVKPANIMLTADGRVVLIDFGMAYLERSDLSTPKAWKGTPAYMSPEQAEGRSDEVQGPSDVFSLGIVFHELLTNQRLFEGPDPKVVIYQILNRPIRPPLAIDPSVPPELDAIVRRALARDASGRFPDGGAMAAEIRRWLAGHSEPPPGPGNPLDRLRRWVGQGWRRSDPPAEPRDPGVRGDDRHPYPPTPLPVGHSTDDLAAPPGPRPPDGGDPDMPKDEGPRRDDARSVPSPAAEDETHGLPGVDISSTNIPVHSYLIELFDHRKSWVPLILIAGIGKVPPFGRNHRLLEAGMDTLAEKHVLFTNTPQGLRIAALDSLNGIYRRITGPVVLEDGTRFRIGDYVIEYRDAEPHQDLSPQVAAGGERFLARDLGPLAYLHFIRPDGRTGVQFPILRGSETVLGRGGAEGNDTRRHVDVPLPNDGLVSRQHARIRRGDADRFVLEDLSKRNGTYVQIREPTYLTHHDMICLGQVYLRVVLDPLMRPTGDAAVEA